jgi:adenylate cyclase class 2
MNELTENEIKLFCPDLEAVAQRLRAAGANVKTPRVFERNVRYENEGKTLSPNGIVVRLRQDNRTRLTYKDPATVTDGIMERLEAEVDVSDFDTMELILGKLGYAPYMIYEKYRTTYTLNGAEIVLDEMPYGNFIEIEGDTAVIEQLIALLDLGGAPRYGQSYTSLFDRVREHLKLDFTDLTFENFAGIDVPERAFVRTAP